VVPELQHEMTKSEGQVLSPTRTLWHRKLVRAGQLLFCWAIGILNLLSYRTNAQTAREYEVKAIFLYNFVQFVEWPPSAFEDPSSPIRIGILGANPLGRTLEETVKNETVRNRKVVILQARQIDELKNCHMAFIARGEKGKLAEVISVVDSRPILTVSEVDGFLQMGGIVNFYLDGKKIRFEVNPETAQRQQLKISSELLALGKRAILDPSRKEK
jgi:hypothetical protein